jgi:hypothetical protein
MHDALSVAGMIAFFTERLNLVIDGLQADRPVSAWS